ncbi:EamA-like transporter family protein OS=Eoetvoesiella caeni OX=645616 GN=DFR37_105272 PE=4 SV=1 [Eoetvoesiella caeni]
MLTLILSIACSVAVSILLKLARRHRLHIGQAIAANYAVAAGLCLALLQPHPAQLLDQGTSWFVLIALGILLPAIFLAMAAAIRHAGIVLSDSAQRLSLFLPLLASFLIFGEALSPAPLIGIVLAFSALGCLLIRPQTSTNATAGRTGAALLLAVWAGYGSIDILFKLLAKSGAGFSASLFAAFVLAGALMLAGLLAMRTQWQARNLAAGLLLGLLNFGNIYFYIRAHQLFPDNPTLVFTAMNIGVIVFGTMAGMVFFREQPSRLNLTGVVLAITAITALVLPVWTR